MLEGLVSVPSQGSLWALRMKHRVSVGAVCLKIGLVGPFSTKGSTPRPPEVITDSWGSYGELDDNLDGPWVL